MRLLHWSLVICIATAWFTRELLHPIHQYSGYAAAVIVTLRLAWPRCGNVYAHFGQFVHGPGVVRHYLAQHIAGRAPRYLGHNPLGGWMILALLLCVALLAASGAMLDTDLLWGYAWPVLIHASLGWLLVGCIVLHLAGVAFSSWQHRENLIAAMFSGNKKDDSSDQQAGSDKPCI